MITPRFSGGQWRFCQCVTRMLIKRSIPVDLYFSIKNNVFKEIVSSILLFYVENIILHQYYLKNKVNFHF
jgi:hypothetical protein